MPLVQGPESHVSARKVDEDGPAVQQLLSHITRGEVLHGVVGHDQESVVLTDPLCLDGERRLVIALAVREKRHRELQGFVLLHHPSSVRRLDEGTLTGLG
ncbi:hypothetical protein [Streptomyces torulosus]|uniref:hypothetical protein n=1 Tax=Streptomyces torulosus TaxID=68276 RepID=UPI0006EBDD8F